MELTPSTQRRIAKLQAQADAIDFKVRTKRTSIPDKVALLVRIELLKNGFTWYRMYSEGNRVKFWVVNYYKGTDVINIFKKINKQLADHKLCVWFTGRSGGDIYIRPR